MYKITAMTVRLNLTLNESVVKRIKSYAAHRKVSVSQIVEEQLEEILRVEKRSIKDSRSRKKHSSEDDSFRKFLDTYAGSIPGHVDYNEAKSDYLRKKHGT